MPDEELRRVLFQLLAEAHTYEPDVTIAERDAVERFAVLVKQWEENHE